MENIHQTQSVVPINQSIPKVLSVLPVFKQPAFPGMMVPITLNSDSLSLNLDKDLKVGQFFSFFLVKKEYEKNSIEEITPEMLYHIGTVGKIIKKFFLPNGSINLIINCFYRIELTAITHPHYPLIVETEILKEKDPITDLESKVLINTIAKQMEYLGKENSFLYEQVTMAIKNAESYSRAADFIASIMTEIEQDKLQDLLETIIVRKRLEKIAILLEEKVSMQKLQDKMMEQINQKVDSQQREFLLKEKLKAIQEELGLRTDPKQKEMNKFQEQFEKIKNHLSSEGQETLEYQIEKFQMTDIRSAEYSILVNYIDLALFLPWDKEVKKNISLSAATKILNDRHYGIDDVKDRILEFLAIHKLKKNQTKGSVICFVGPPGVGKTSLGKAIADALGRPFFRFSVGGMRDEAEIKGHRRTYIGAMPGKIIQGIKTSQASNPVFMIDEIDKIASSSHGDPSSALLEVLDPEQNYSFRDHYLDIPFDISKVLFITTANSISTIPAALLDRMEIIHLSGYIPEEKYIIGKYHILGKQLMLNGLEKEEFSLTKKAYIYIAEKYSREAGIRNFEQQIAKLCRKIALRKVQEKLYPKKIDVGDLEVFLGIETFSQDEKKRIRAPGISIGLAWTSLGGDTLYIESLLVPSKQGSLKLTGQLGDVMQESAEIAYNYLKSQYKKYKLPLSVIENHMLHLHVPAGAVPKDGPSAGITMATAMYSLITHKKVPHNFAMTGELTLTGNVLPIGGIKEKSIAAVRAGIENIIMPIGNTKDLADIPEIIKKYITYHPVSTLDEVLNIIFYAK